MRFLRWEMSQLASCLLSKGSTKSSKLNVSLGPWTWPISSISTGLGLGNCPFTINALTELQNSLILPDCCPATSASTPWCFLGCKDNRKQAQPGFPWFSGETCPAVLSLQPISADGAQRCHLAGHLPLPQPWRLWKVLRPEDRGRPPGTMGNSSHSMGHGFHGWNQWPEAMENYGKIGTLRHVQMRMLTLTHSLDLRLPTEAFRCTTKIWWFYHEFLSTHCTNVQWVERWIHKP